jgi:hypothetical protein
MGKNVIVTISMDDNGDTAEGGERSECLSWRMNAT